MQDDNGPWSRLLLYLGGSPSQKFTYPNAEISWVETLKGQDLGLWECLALASADTINGQVLNFRRMINAEYQ